MRRIMVVIGSDSDLPQCERGLTYLGGAVQHEKAEVQQVVTASIHRNTREVLRMLHVMHRDEYFDVLITGAGMANHLSGMCDAFLRYALRDERIVVIGVAFRDADNHTNTEAARLSISQVPKTQAIYQDDVGQFVGADGFYRACVLAVEGVLPAITAPEPREMKVRTLGQALALIWGGCDDA